MISRIHTLGLGGGCHWCTEAVFQPLRGISRVEQGWFSASPPHDNWSEAVRIRFDPDEISLEDLIGIHLRTHASTSAHSMRGKYRSAVYVKTNALAKSVQDALSELQAGFDSPLVTQVLSARAFKSSPPKYRDYYRKDPSRPFCRAYIEPKLTLLRHEFGSLLES